jgi:hypothetical protein
MLLVTPAAFVRGVVQVIDSLLINGMKCEDVEPGYAVKQAHAIKQVITWQIEQAMKAQGITKVEMARRMHTSRTQVDRLLDPNNDDKVQLDTVQRAASAIGRKLKIELVAA